MLTLTQAQEFMLQMLPFFNHENEFLLDNLYVFSSQLPRINLLNTPTFTTHNSSFFASTHNVIFREIWDFDLSK